jgi:excisionase family DNA binding protein
MKDSPTQFHMRENTASSRRHGSRSETGSFSNGSCNERSSRPADDLASVQVHSPADAHITVKAAAPNAATRGQKDNADCNAAAVLRSSRSQKPMQTFEPLIGSCEAAKLLGNIHLKTLQRYARHRIVPGYQIGGHWYFRASELDSWLQSQINLSCHPCRLQEKSDGT